MRVLEMGRDRQILGLMAKRMAYHYWTEGILTKNYKDTADIASEMGVSEAAVYNSLAEIRDQLWEEREKALR